MDVSFQKKPPDRARHPEHPELLDGLKLSGAALRARADVARIAPLVEMIANAEYWLSFDLASFEPLLARSPSPFRELGVGIALRFGEGIDGSVMGGDVIAARSRLLPELPPDLLDGVARGLDTLERAINAREATSRFTAEGFEAYTPAVALSVHALMAAGKSAISVGGALVPPSKPLSVLVGQPIALAATDERGRPIEPPEIEGELGAPLMVRKEPTGRTVILMVPGKYRLRVPGRSEGGRVLMAR